MRDRTYFIEGELLLSQQAYKKWRDPAAPSASHEDPRVIAPQSCSVGGDDGSRMAMVGRER